MKKKRLRHVRDVVKTLAPYDEVADHTTITSDIDDLYKRRGPAPIEVLDMTAFHGRTHCRTAGCIAGVALCAFPKEARPIVRKFQKKGTEVPPVSTIAQELLGLDDDQSHELFQLTDAQHETPERAVHACDRLLDGAAPDTLWT